MSQQISYFGLFVLIRTTYENDFDVSGKSVERAFSEMYTFATIWQKKFELQQYVLAYVEIPSSLKETEQFVFLYHLKVFGLL